MLKRLLQALGWVTAHTPESVLRGFSILLGEAILLFVWKRRRIVYSNLHHAFPQKPRAWHRRIARQSTRRFVETALLSLATPYLSEDRLRIIITARPSVQKAFSDYRLKPAAVIIGAPHIAYWEAQTALPMFVEKPFPEFGIIFRPLDNPVLDEWVKGTRGRFGLRMLSRREGFQEAMKILRRRGFIGLLFDQNAGMGGALTTLLGRVCSTTELSGLLAGKFHARVYGFYSRRHSFWRIEMSTERVETDGTPTGVTLGLNRWLEGLLQRDDDLCASWLWGHDRWRNQDIPEKRLRLEAKRNLLPEDLLSSGNKTLPRKTRFWIRLPNWLGDVVMVLPLLRALRVSRPDAEITLLAKSSFAPLLERTGLADRVRALPPRGLGYFFHFWKLRREFPDVYLLLTHSVRGDLEAWLTRCRQRFGIVKIGRRRPLLTHRYLVPPSFDEAQHHQLELWENFFVHFGLNAPIERTPILAQPAKPTDGVPTFGVIPGSENNPEKRWPIEHWRHLLKGIFSRHPNAVVHLFGTVNDATITAAVAAGFGPGVRDLAGKTDLAAFMDQLSRCDVLITNDTGGMHLANSLGLPLIGLFGPTNPVRTGPIFSAHFIILQPPGCAPTGGGSLRELAPEIVLAALDQLKSAELARD